MRGHHLFLLHVWREPVESQTFRHTWRAALEQPHTGQRWGFSSPAELCAFLEQIGTSTTNSPPNANAQSRHEDIP